jgi:hypothetical protein
MRLPLKEGSAARPPYLPFFGILGFDNADQRAGQHIRIETIRSRCNHQFAKLLHLSGFKLFRLVSAVVYACQSPSLPVEAIIV